MDSVREFFLRHDFTIMGIAAPKRRQNQTIHILPSCRPFAATNVLERADQVRSGEPR